VTAAPVAAAPISAVAFDLDGTLVDLERFHHGALLRAAEDVGVVLTWAQALDRLAHFIGGPDARVAAEVASLAPAGVSAAEVLAAKRRYFSSMVGAAGRIDPRAGVRKVLDRLAGRGLPLAVGTVTERETALGILDRAGLLTVFGEGAVVTGSDVPRLKPAPEVYQETARRLGVPPAEQLVFEDSVTGMTAARSAGSPLVALPTGRDGDYLAAAAACGAAASFPAWHDRGLLPWLERATGGRARRA